LGSQNERAKKSGLGFKDPNKIMKIKCFYCDRLGHDESVCYVKKKLTRKNKINLSLERSHLNRSEVHKRLRRLRRHVSTVINLIIQVRMLL